MKKTFVTAVLLSIFLLGCGDDRYLTEKQYYHTLKQAEKIFKNPNATPPNELKKVIYSFSGFSRKFPRSKLAVDAEFNIARLYIVKEEYENARAQLKRILDTYSKVGSVCSEAVFLTGNSYQIENKWNLALTQYKKIMRDYPATLRGINVPIYVMQYYKAKFQPDKMADATREAISHYNALAERYPGSLLAYQSQLLTAECYAVLKEWQNVIDTLNDLVEKYHNKVNMDGALMNIAMIYSKELKDNRKAKEILQRLIKDYPKSKLIKAAESIIGNE